MTKVINSPCAASRARVDCVPYSSQSGFIDKPFSSQSTCASVRVREMGLAKSTFSDRLKKVEKLLSRL